MTDLTIVFLYESKTFLIIKTNVLKVVVNDDNFVGPNGSTTVFNKIFADNNECYQPKTNTIKL